ncbi:MAG: tetratricopeptide (TPR) repeat protein [Myxococcota bacterium]|jgi:tetratricopeptide (TPR) repeat protein
MFHAWIARIVVGVVSLASGSANAADGTAGLDELASRILPIVQQAQRLDAQVRASGRDYLSEDEALVRYQDNVYAFILADHRKAAEGFFGLVTTGALLELGLHTDAEWYLAESLFELDNYLTAEGRYLAIMEAPRHPFREDAVGRLLELYSESGDLVAFEAFYANQVGRGGFATSPKIRYAVAKSRYDQGDVARAVEEFGKIRPGPVWYAKAQYWLGAIHVVDGRLDDAVLRFQAAADQSVDSVEARDVVDLAWLALGRIAYERGQLLEALEFYNRVSAESTFTPDKYYELVWTAIRREEWQDALNSIDIFLLAYPEHEYSAQLQLVRGQLHMQIASRTDGFRRDDSFTAALGAFEAVVDAYAPVRDRFRSLSDSESDPSAYLEQVVYLEAGGREALPSFALSMMRSDPELSRAISVFAQLGAQERDLAVSERLVEELQSVLRDNGGLANLGRLRVDAGLYRASNLEAELDLLAAEEAWLLNGGAPPARSSVVQALARDREALLARVTAFSESVDRGQAAFNERESAMSGARAQVVAARTTVNEHAAAADGLRLDLASSSALDARLLKLEQARKRLADHEAALAALEGRSGATRVVVEPGLVSALSDQHTSYLGLRAGSGGNEGERLDRMFADVERVNALLDHVDGSLESVVASETARIRARFDIEVQEVATQRRELGLARGAGEAVSVALTREGFGRLEDFFSQSVLKADSGIIDVYWAQKLQTADEIDRAKRERNKLLEELEARFTLIRQKIGE